MIQFKLNGKPRSFDGDPSMPLLWYVRDIAGLTGTKFGCGMGLCGACTVHRNGQAVRSCSTPMSTVAGQEIVTIEAIAGPDKLHPVQIAWIENSVPQCGYCQSGQIMQAVALLAETPSQLTSRSRTRWPATFAAAAPISAFVLPSSRLRG